MTSVAEVVSAVQTSKRYQWVLPAVVERLASEEIPKSRNAADAQKRTKRRLHQIFGAYASPLPYATMAARIDALPPGADELEALCRWMLGLHSSTRERLPLLPAFYRRHLPPHGPTDEHFRRRLRAQPVRLAVDGAGRQLRVLRV